VSVAILPLHPELLFHGQDFFYSARIIIFVLSFFLLRSYGGRLSCSLCFALTRRVLLHSDVVLLQLRLGS